MSYFVSGNYCFSWRVWLSNFVIFCHASLIWNSCWKSSRFWVTTCITKQKTKERLEFLNNFAKKAQFKFYSSFWRKSDKSLIQNSYKKWNLLACLSSKSEKLWFWVVSARVDSVSCESLVALDTFEFEHTRKQFPEKVSPGQFFRPQTCHKFVQFKILISNVRCLDFSNSID